MNSAPINDSAGQAATGGEVAPAAKKAPGQRPAGKKAAAKKAGAKKATARKSAPGSGPARKRAAKKAPAPKGTARKGTGEKGGAQHGARKGTAKKAAARDAGGAASKRAGGRPGEARRSLAGRFGRGRKASAAAAASSGPGAAASAGKRTPAKKAAARKHARRLVVREDEAPWTPKELQEVRGELQTDAKRLQSEIAEADNDVRTLMRDNGDGAGNDQADVGSNTFERDHEMAIVAQHREMLEQVERALSRIQDGTYGICERCGNPIGKMRLMAFPRATLCVPCKQREERR